MEIWKRHLVPSPAILSLFSRRASGLLSEGTHLSFPHSIRSPMCPFLPSPAWADTACTGDNFRDAYSLEPLTAGLLLFG